MHTSVPLIVLTIERWRDSSPRSSMCSTACRSSPRSQSLPAIRTEIAASAPAGVAKNRTPNTPRVGCVVVFSFLVFKKFQFGDATIEQGTVMPAIKESCTTSADGDRMREESQRVHWLPVCNAEYRTERQHGRERIRKTPSVSRVNVFERKGAIGDDLPPENSTVVPRYHTPWTDFHSSSTLRQTAVTVLQRWDRFVDRELPEDTSFSLRHPFGSSRALETGPQRVVSNAPHGTSDSRLLDLKFDIPSNQSIKGSSSTVFPLPPSYPLV